MRWEKSQQASETPDPFGHAEPSTSEDHASPHATPSSSSRRRRDSPFDASLPLYSRKRQVSPIQVHKAVNSPSDASLPPYSRKRQVSLIQAHKAVNSPVAPPTIDAYQSVPLPSADVVDPVPPSKGETAADAEPYAFG